MIKISFEAESVERLTEQLAQMACALSPLHPQVVEEEPYLPKHAAPEYEPKHAAPEEKHESSVTETEVRSALRDFMAKNGTSAAKQILEAFGVKSFTEIDQSKYDEVMAKIEEASKKATKEAANAAT